jgi:hypothetical protein
MLTERKDTEEYLKHSGWTKDACGWWIAPFGYGFDEAIALHKDASERTARAMETNCPDLIPRWLENERATFTARYWEGTMVARASLQKEPL